MCVTHVELYFWKSAVGITKTLKYMWGEPKPVLTLIKILSLLHLHKTQKIGYVKIHLKYIRYTYKF
jgi:hypothetical protein